MTSPLVETKFFIPASRPGMVARPRLSDRLARDDGHLTLVSAPAGFGKTTLLRRWLTAADRHAKAEQPADAPAVAWVSLDEGDRDPSSFWTYVVTALDRAAPGVGASTLP